ncbi:MauE/DoxX family redox-associated membrane protein [Amaricoccus sp.]|uniref:MauE/DoxX family redox-associated membrane protein n=1 Tax=Amaricoccus sp. TaxID=1872485 RepID=UPI001B42124C|nr:MauE/DoxX family redox-associated membrane protein [Amaricoccus sp.]MBP7002304.1 hypothetical protein [Amaricoccus sp.]
MSAVDSVALRTELLYLMQLGLGIFWLIAAIAKLRSPRAAKRTVRNLLFGRGGGAVARGPRSVVGAVIAVETAVGLMLLSGWQARPAALVSLAMLVGFIGVLVADAMQGSRAHGNRTAAAPAGGCGCLGALRGERPGSSSGVGLARGGLPAAIARNFFLAVVSLGVASGVHGACACAAFDHYDSSTRLVRAAPQIDGKPAVIFGRSARHA